MKIEKLKTSTAWRLTLGAEAMKGGVRFRVWAPKRTRVEVVLTDRNQTFALERENEGYSSGFAPGAEPGDLYFYRLDGGNTFPDPCSRYQPQGPHDPSMVVDPGAFQWTDGAWPGAAMRGQVIYEMHIGTFTREGTFDAAREHFDDLRRLGITMLEVMPVAEFPGRWNWGYDGVGLYAPSHTYGDPEAFKRFVDEAHRAGLAVILDVVYNHLGPDGNYLPAYSNDFFPGKCENEWGEAINFEGPGGVREYFVQNACYWVAEFHLDGLRLDATQNICDNSPVHVLAEISESARRAAGERSIVLIAENEPQQVKLLAGIERGGYGLDAMWNDDFHHTARVALTGRREAYYTDYLGTPQEFISAVRRVFLFQGQHYAWQKKGRGSPVTSQPAESFVCYLQNHDQVANYPSGARLSDLASPGCYRAMTALLLLSPETPMLFMGQEFGASSPFLYFADHKTELEKPVREGREHFLAQFPSYGTSASQEQIPPPGALETFDASKLDWSERERGAATLRLYQDLLRLRRDDAVIAAQRRDCIDGAVIGPQAFLLRYFGERQGDDRLVVVNLGAQFDCVPAPEPLLAPPSGASWEMVWSSDHPRYGGPGAVSPSAAEGWRIAGQAAVLLKATGGESKARD